MKRKNKIKSTVNDLDKYHVHFLLQNTQPAVEINDPDGHVIAYGHKENGLFIFDGTTCLPEEHANITILSDLELVNDSVEKKMDEPPQKKSTGSLTTWHKHLGHVAKATVKKLSKKQMVKEWRLTSMMMRMRLTSALLASKAR